MRPVFPSKFHALAARIEAIHATAIRLEHLDRQQADKAEARNANRFTECRLNEPDALQSYGANDRETRSRIIHTIGDRHDKVLWRRVHIPSGDRWKPPADRP